MESNLFSIRFDDSNSPAAKVVMAGGAAPVREYLAGPENALLGHVVASNNVADETHQPVLLFGPSGSGKSHLLRGIIERYQASHPTASIRSLNSADFCREFSTAHEIGSLDEVRQTLRDVDCLAIDDVHGLADKSYAQTELSHLLDALKVRGACIFLTSRLALNELSFSPALKSRLSGGLTVPIQVPGLATRSSFIRRFANELEVELSDDVVEHLARVTPASIPGLQGLVMQLQQTHLDEGRPIDVDLALLVIQQRAKTNVPGVREIIKKVARYFGLTVAELTGPSRRQTTVLARDTAIFLTRQLRHDSFEQIGVCFGGRDHSTVMHAFKKIKKKRHDSLVNAAIEELVQRLGVQHCDL